MDRATFFVRGRVQGVGFRAWTKGTARELGVDGFVRNLDDGRVEVAAQGERGAVTELEARLREQPSGHGRPGRVSDVTARWGAPRGDVEGFREL